MHVCKVLSVLFLILLLSVQFLRIRYFFNFVKEIDLDKTFNQYCVWIVFMQACSIVVFFFGRSGADLPDSKKKKKGGGVLQNLFYFFTMLIQEKYVWFSMPGVIIYWPSSKEKKMAIYAYYSSTLAKNDALCMRETHSFFQEWGFKGFFLSIDGFGGLIQYPLSVTLLCHFNTFEFLSGVRPHATLVPRI